MTGRACLRIGRAPEPQSAGPATAPVCDMPAPARAAYPGPRILRRPHLDADHVVDNDPALEPTGRDQQLEKAVEVLMKKVPKK